jgi:hypothetical protein
MTMRHTTDRLEAPHLRGRMFAIIDSPMSAESAANELYMHGFDDVVLLHGESGLSELERIMEGKQWGESAENVYHDGISALHEGHSLLFIEVKDVDAAARIADLLKPYGAHEVYHFGDLVDTRLTA